MQNNVKNKSKISEVLGRLAGQQIFIPIAALLLLAIFNLIMDPSFYTVTLGHNNAGDPVLSGYLITILDYGSELAILAIGMTLVTAATGGQDISVGAAIAISGSVILRVLCGTDSRPDTLQAPIIVAFLISCVVAMLFGAFNGALVAYFKIQPMVATLILFTAGRSIAAHQQQRAPHRKRQNIYLFWRVYSRDSHSDAVFHSCCLYDSHSAGIEIHEPETVYTGCRHQREFFQIEWLESAVYQVPDLCDFRTVCCGCGAYQGKPSFIHQLLCHSEGY